MSRTGLGLDKSDLVVVRCSSTPHRKIYWKCQLLQSMCMSCAVYGLEFKDNFELYCRELKQFLWVGAQNFLILKLPKL